MYKTKGSSVYVTARLVKYWFMYIFCLWILNMQLLLVITDQTVISAPTSPSNLSTNTLVASSGSDSSGQDPQTQPPVSSAPQPDSTEYPSSQSPSKGSSPKTSPSRTSPSKITSPSKTTPSQEYIHKESERCVIQFSIYRCILCTMF